MNLNPTRVLAVIGAALVLMIGGAVAYASDPRRPTAPSPACMVKTSGTIRLIDAEAGATCRSTEKEVTWNQAGQPGIDGVSGYETVDSGRGSRRSASVFSSLQANCPTGKKVTGGGCRDHRRVRRFLHSTTTWTCPIPTADNTGWFAIFDVENSIGQHIHRLSVYAICATVTP